MLLLAFFETAQGYLTDTMALAAVALIGYLFGHRTRKQPEEIADDKLDIELSKAVQVAKELHQVAQGIRQDVAAHQSSIANFKTRVSQLKSKADVDGWQVLCGEAEALLVPTMKLATNLSLAYDQLRKQSNQLMNFAGSRSDPLTGVHNRRAMEEQLEVLFSLHVQNDSRFSLALFSAECSVEGEASQAETDELLRDFAELLENCARDTDFVARYSPDEFVVLMPQTTLAGATVFSNRFMRRADAELNCIAGCGLVEILPEESPEKLLSRADSALYSARANGVSCLFLHNGKTIRPHDQELQAEPSADKEAADKETIDEPLLLDAELSEPSEAVCLQGQASEH